MPLLATAGARGLSLVNVLSLAQQLCCPVTMCFVASHLVAQPFTSDYMPLDLSPQVHLLVQQHPDLC